MTKICVECKHSTRDWVLDGYLSECKKFVITPAEINKVTGEVVPPYYGLCVFARDEGKECGPEGKLWEPKEPNRFQRMISKLLA